MFNEVTTVYLFVCSGLVRVDFLVDVFMLLFVFGGKPEFA